MAESIETSTSLGKDAIALARALAAPFMRADREVQLLYGKDEKPVRIFGDKIASAAPPDALAA